MQNLGIVYEEGLGVERDLKTAIPWYRRAAEEGNEAAKKRLRVLEKE